MYSHTIQTMQVPLRIMTFASISLFSVRSSLHASSWTLVTVEAFIRFSDGSSPNPKLQRCQSIAVPMINVCALLYWNHPCVSSLAAKRSVGQRRCGAAIASSSLRPQLCARQTGFSPLKTIWTGFFFVYARHLGRFTNFCC